MHDEEQMDFEFERDTDKILVENTTLTADRVLQEAIGKHDQVFLIGIEDDGFAYYSNSGDAYFWNYALDRAKRFIMGQMD